MHLLAGGGDHHRKRLGDEMSLPTPYYEEDGIIIFHADARDVVGNLEPIGLLLTDPPFESEAHTLQRRVKRTGGVMEIEPLPFMPMTTFDRQLFASALSRLIKGWALTFCQIEAAPYWRASYEQAGMIYKRTCVWVKPDGMPQYSGDRPGMGYETFVAMHAPKASKWNGGGHRGVWIINKNEGIGPNEHPTQKPLKLMKELVHLFSQPQDTVFDPFMGSGTTLVAAKNLGRKAIGIEIEEKYCELAVRRLAQAVLPL